MDKIITIKVKNYYGNDLYYVVSDHATPLKCLTGRKTLTKKDVEALRSLGYEFKLENVLSA